MVNMKLVHCPLMGGILYLVQQRVYLIVLPSAMTHSCCAKYDSPLILVIMSVYKALHCCVNSAQPSHQSVILDDFIQKINDGEDYFTKLEGAQRVHISAK